MQMLEARGLIRYPPTETSKSERRAVLVDNLRTVGCLFSAAKA